MTEYVAGLLFCQDYVALVQKTRPDWQAGRWNGIGGHVENDEAPIQAMRREFQEEAGVTIQDWKHFAELYGKAKWSGESEWRVSWYTALTNDFDCIKTITDEFVGWHRVSNLPNVLPNLVWLIPMARLDSTNWPYKITERYCEPNRTHSEH